MKLVYTFDWNTVLEMQPAAGQTVEDCLVDQSFGLALSEGRRVHSTGPDEADVEVRCSKSEIQVVLAW